MAVALDVLEVPLKSLRCSSCTVGATYYRVFHERNKQLLHMLLTRPLHTASICSFLELLARSASFDLGIPFQDGKALITVTPTVIHCEATQTVTCHRLVK